MTSQIFKKVRSRLDYYFIDKPASMTFLPSPRNLLVGSLFLLISISLLMIASASIPFAISKGANPLHYFYSQLSYLGIGLMTGFIAYKIPLRFYHSFSHILAILVLCFIGLIVTLTTPEVNGSRRWIDIGPVSFQVAELCKVMMIFATAEYAVRRSADVRKSIFLAWRLLLFYVPIALLLMLQPDFGTFAVITSIVIIILFVAGSPFAQILAIGAAAGVAFVIAILFEPYRRQRIISAFDPLADANDSGFQVTNSLVAFARGDFLGAGYGESVQKLSYLPEAHTDFLLAITGEELGLLGTLTVIGLEFLIVIAIMSMSYIALKRRQLRMSYALFGLGVLIFGQTLINAGMNLGVMPAKGLTLPFFSYGGSSLLVLLTAMGYVLQADKLSPSIAANKKHAEY